MTGRDTFSSEDDENLIAWSHDRPPPRRGRSSKRGNTRSKSAPANTPKSKSVRGRSKTKNPRTQSSRRHSPSPELSPSHQGPSHSKAVQNQESTDPRQVPDGYFDHNQARRNYDAPNYIKNKEGAAMM